MHQRNLVVIIVITHSHCPMGSWRGQQMTVEWLKTSDFSALGHCVCGTFRDKVKIIVW